MDWYCAVWNSDSVSSAAGASVLYEMLCEGDTSLVGDIDIINDFYKDLMEKGLKINAHVGKGFVMIEGMLENAEELDFQITRLAKTHGLSYFEPQNYTFVF